MIGTPDGSGSRSGVIAKFNRGCRIPARGFDRRDLESKHIPGLESTTNMELNIAPRMLAGDTGSFSGFLANFANFSKPVGWYQLKPLGGLQLFGIAKLDLWRPDCTHNVNPVVAHCTFQGFSGAYRFAYCFLSLAVELDCLGNHLFFQSFLFPFSI
jgi:hypothetical protein